MKSKKASSNFSVGTVLAIFLFGFLALSNFLIWIFSSCFFWRNWKDV